MSVGANSVLSNLAQLAPDSDKSSVIAAIDTAVDDLIAQLNSDTQAVANPEFLEQTKQTIIFLEACTGFPDPEFTEHARHRMLELQGLLISAHDFYSEAYTNDPEAESAPASPVSGDDRSDAPPEAAS